MQIVTITPFQCYDTSHPTKLVLPDLVSHCNFEVKINRHHKQAAAESKRWIFQGDNLGSKKRQAVHGLKAGYLTSMCYPHVGYPQLRIYYDFINYLFHLDDLSDDMDKNCTQTIADVVLNSLVSGMTKDYWRRHLSTSSRGSQQRFVETFDFFFFQAVTQQAKDRAKRVMPTLRAYIAERRDNNGCKPCRALIEYANNLDIPDHVMEHSVIRSLGEAANDVVTWSNSKGDPHNMIPVVMNERGLDLQSAVDFVGDLCKKSMDRFNDDKLNNLPSWGPKIEKDVAIYVGGGRLDRW
ncbi:terpenoid synthase [Athelia psychrophila]|uniref:Terpene synthase n=1 Tax=Athelia psychrophila TaxID=1759441 RepID=A0A166EHA8_9AGAM|nr:terpenoid synthase [Fibularhizoctonia sp. CBS 109695]